MRSIKSFLLGLMIIPIIWGCDESDSATEPEELKNYTEEVSNFIPASLGDSFLYNVDTLNQTSGKYESIGSRLMKIYNVEEAQDRNTFRCTESFNFLDGNIQSESMFQLTQNSIEYFGDSTGLSAVIPDSVVVEVELVLNELSKIVEFPLVKNQVWKVFNVIVKYGTFNFNTYEVVGEYVGAETIKVDGFENSFETEKFEYSITINIPNMDNVFVRNIQEYDATVWFSPGVGLVKMEGCALFIDPITGIGLNIADSNKVIRHTLVSQ